MKKIIGLLIVLSALGCKAQTNDPPITNLTVRVDVPQDIVEAAKFYMNTVNETNLTVRQWLSSNLTVDLPPNVKDTVNTRKRDMQDRIANGTWDFLKPLIKFFYPDSK